MKIEKDIEEKKLANSSISSFESDDWDEEDCDCEEGCCDSEDVEGNCPASGCIGCSGGHCSR